MGIAVTGEAAHKANRVAAKIRTDFDVFAAATETGLKQDDKIKVISSSQKEIAQYTRDIDAAQIGCVKKEKLREAVKALKKKVDAEDKKIKAEKQKLCIELVEKTAKELTDPYVVLRLDDANANGKVLSEAMKVFKKSAPEAAVMLISCDTNAGRIACSSQVPKSKLGKIKANAWVSELSKTINGKGGGKDLNAMASGNNVEAADAAVDLAKQFAACKLN